MMDHAARAGKGAGAREERPMSEHERIRDQHVRAFAGPAWSGPSVLESLEGVGARAAAARPLPGAHTIWEIVLHVATWEDVVARRLAGEAYSPGEAQDWPPMGPPTDEAWTEARGLLECSRRAVENALAAIDEARLDQPVVGQSYSAYVMAHGACQHALYHAGQIALLKKAALG
jgi:uncharacterized damage-inducible protein DinB